MIAFIRGNFVRKTAANVVVDVNGVGYELHISLNTYTAIANLDKGLLHTYFHVREDAQILFGFAEDSEKELFIQLISVSGVGASTARMMLSSPVLTPDAADEPERIQFERIVSGLAKQLRSVLDRRLGRYSVDLPVFPPVKP